MLHYCKAVLPYGWDGHPERLIMGLRRVSQVVDRHEPQVISCLISHEIKLLIFRAGGPDRTEGAPCLVETWDQPPQPLQPDNAESSTSAVVRLLHQTTFHEITVHTLGGVDMSAGRAAATRKPCQSPKPEEIS